MPLGLQALLAFIPILTVLILMVSLRWPATRVMPVAWLIAVLIAAIVWQTPFQWIAVSSLNGVFIAFKILIIIFGAVGIPIWGGMGWTLDIEPIKNAISAIGKKSGPAPLWLETKLNMTIFRCGKLGFHIS